MSKTISYWLTQTNIGILILMLENQWLRKLKIKSEQLYPHLP